MDFLYVFQRIYVRYMLVRCESKKVAPPKLSANIFIHGESV